MAEGLEAIEVTAGVSLSEIAELVASTHESKLLSRSGRIVAMVMPFGMKPSKTGDGLDAFKKAAGSWKEIDTDRFLAANRQSRAVVGRPAVDL
jgi:hypothetical protein